MSMTTKEALAFRARKTRELAPNGVASFTQREIDETMLEVMREGETPPQFMYAYMKTKRIVSNETAANLSDEELAEWDAAVNEYLDDPDPSRIPKPGTPSPYDVETAIPPRGRTRWRWRR